MTSFLAGAIKFGGNNASVTGDFISIAETEQGEKNQQYYVDQTRYIASILESILECFDKTSKYAKILNGGIAYSSVQKALLMISHDSQNPYRYNGDLSRATWFQIYEAIVHVAAVLVDVADLLVGKSPYAKVTLETIGALVSVAGVIISINVTAYRKELEFTLAKVNNTTKKYGINLYGKEGDLFKVILSENSTFESCYF